MIVFMVGKYQGNEKLSMDKVLHESGNVGTDFLEPARGLENQPFGDYIGRGN
jgi:hypothetical protein